MLNTSLQTAAQGIIDNPSPGQFIINAKFFNSQSGAGFSFYPLIINKLTKKQDFVNNYGDVIDLSMMISLKDYALMQDQGQNLLCLLTITYVDRFGKVVYSPAPIQKQYNVMINDPRDVRKAIPDIQHYTQPSTPLTVRLVEPTIYQLRHTKVNNIFPNMTMTQVVYALTQFFGIQKIRMEPLDNSHQYDHVVIPSYQGIDSIFGYLNATYGLYQKGVSSYITDGVLHIYPSFETKPTYDKTASFYQVGTGDYAGADVMHQVTDKNVSVVVNTQSHSYDMSIAGSENHGTGFVFTRASRTTDGFTTIDSQSGVKFTEQPALSVNLASGRTMTEGLNNLVHVKTTDNPFPHMAKIINHQASLMQMAWREADPFQIDPGHAVQYFYDQNSVMTKKTGIIENALFEITKVRKVNENDVFSAVGTLGLRLEPNSSQVF